MNYLLLCEGDPTTRDSWSGSSNSLLNHLREAGHTVYSGNVELSGWSRYLAAAGTFSPNIDRWRTRFRLGRIPFRLRSRRAQRELVRRDGRGGPIESVLQIGATFDVNPSGGVSKLLYCDSNIAMARRLSASNFSHASRLSETEVSAVADREREVYQNADLIFTISDRLRASFIEDFGIADGRVRTVYAGPNFDKDITEKALRSSVARGNGGVRILFLGRNFERKGGDLVLDSFLTLKGDFSDLELVIAGCPPRDLDYEGVTELGWLDKDTPDGKRKLLNAFAEADVFCMPTRFDAFGIVYVEAMYFGLPCVGSDIYAVPEIIDHGETGFVVSPDDQDGLTEQLRRLIARPKLRREMGRAGRRRAVERFSWSTVAERIVSATEEL